MPTGAMLPPPGRPGTDLPVRAALPEVIAALHATGGAVLVAPPGSGKTSLLPLALADAVDGLVIVAEPRRIATRAAARRLAALIGEEPGRRVGYSMRGDTRTSSAGRVEVVTTGVLVRRLQRDPDLAGVSAVIIDECHERHLDSDLALAFCLDVQATLRPELKLVATSATPDAERIAAMLGSAADPAPIVLASAPVYPVDLVWAAPARPIPLLPDARVDPRLLDHVADIVRRALSEATGDVLVFLPGESEIMAVARRLAGCGADVLSLYGRQSAADQDRVLNTRADAHPVKRRVVLTTAVAESSLTVPGVRIVVDAGLSREPRTDHSRGLSTLTTVRVSRSSAEQRAGRAGREGPGRVYRCWTQNEHAHLAAHPLPEIATADLTAFALAAADWGNPAGVGLALLDPPPVPALQSAVGTLRSLLALGPDGRITAHGRAMASVGAQPRLAHALINGSALIGPRRAAEIVALLSEDTLGRHDDDLSAVWRALRTGTDPGASARWREEVRRLGSGRPSAPQQSAPRQSAPRQSAPRPDGAAIPDDVAAAIVVGLAFPERLARLRTLAGPALGARAAGSGPGTGAGPGGGGPAVGARRWGAGGGGVGGIAGGATYLMAGGTGAVLGATSELRGSAWLAIAVADRPSGRADARIRLAAPIDEATARSVAPGLLVTQDDIGWIDGDLRMRQRDLLGAIALRERPLPHPDPVQITAAVRTGLRLEGLGRLRWSADAPQLRQRMALCHRVFGPPWPDVGEQALLDGLDQWLGPELARVRRGSDLARIDAGRALRRLLPWPAASRFEELVPERIEVPSGSRVRLTYTEDSPPVLAVRVQEAFGWTVTPTVADGRVPVVLQLLSPAGRPVAITTDLASFWRQGYPQVRAELRGRYPRHPWPEDPLTAPPTRHIKRS